MNQKAFEPTPERTQRVSSFINVRKLLLIMRRNWHFYLIALTISFGLGYLYMKFKVPVYLAQTTVLIDEDDNNSAGQDLLEGFALRPGVQNLDNQLIIVGSYSMIRRAIEELQFEKNIYRKGLLGKVSYYPMNPLRIESGSGGLPYNIDFVYEYIEGDSFRLKTAVGAGIKLDTVLNFGHEVFIGDKSFTIFPQLEHEDIFRSNKKIYIKFSDKVSLTESYMNRLEVELASRDGSIVELSLRGPNRIKDVMFLDKLTEVYVRNNLEKKNIEAKRVIDFINDQLEGVSDSLEITEQQLQDFRSRERIMDVSAQAQQIVDQAVVLETEQARLALEKNYYEYLEDYLSSENNDKAPIAPASMGITDPNLALLMQELAALQAEYFSSSVGERNPMQSQLELRIRNTKNSMKQTLTGIMEANRMAIEENRQQTNRLNAEAARLPVKERQLLGFERRFNLNNVLYTLLLQRRSEAQIQAASNTPDNELIDAARTGEPISPNFQIVFALAFALALGLPTLYMLLEDTIRNKITSEEDLNLITDLPVLAYFPHSRLSYNKVVLTEPSSRMSEAFRSLRSRLDFIIQDIKAPVILITSSIPGEGKTFTSVNLASSFSLTGKKTLMLGFDLRRPALGKSFELNGKAGLTDYLIAKKDLDAVIQDTGFDNLHIIQAGPIPPNPGELASSEKAIELIKILRKKYDIIIIDSPPIGVVSDIYPVAAVSDAVILMVRHGHSKRNILQATLEELESNGIKNRNLVVNDVKSTGNSYRYAYRYKYDYSKKN